tara:strand:+ start:1230 stop:1889 length:660 start_codon:yes stop_codon:yes gene_type:complete
MFNWKNVEVYNVPYKFVICDNFLENFDDDLFPSQEWCNKNLLTRENSVTKAISAKNSLPLLNQIQKHLLEKILSQEFHNKVCSILNIPLINETTGIRKTQGEYRIAREAMFVENLKTDKNILDVHYDSEVTIWTGLLYFSDSMNGGSFNIHSHNKSIFKKIPIKKNRLILTYNSDNSWHSVSPWDSDVPRKSIYITSEFKNFGRDANRNPIGAKEVWIP